MIPIDGELGQAVKEVRGDVDELLRSRGLKTLRDSAIELYAGGLTSLDDILPFMN